MRVKSIILLLLVLCFSFVFTSCQGNANNVTAEKQAYICDNTTALDAALKNEYSLQELKSFFGEIPPNEIRMYKSMEKALENKSELSIDNVNKRFPIQCLRHEGQIAYYSVYKVKEGGRFYIFWGVDPPVNAENPDVLNNANVYFTAYITSSLNNAEDFNSIIAVESTAEDVSRIDSSFELNFALSSGVRSYSLLADGTVMEIEYDTANGKIESRDDLVVKSKAVISKEKAVSASYLCNINPDDLP